MKYNPSEIEKKWQDKWQEQAIYQASSDTDKKKYYSLVMFPYPSGDLHIGHWYSYTGPDVFARFKRMSGYNVMHPFGFDAFGLPAENAAIKRGFHPDDWTQSNIESMTKQLKTTGIGFDWSRTVNTSDPEYYKWTQWIFLQLYKKGLAYRRKGRVNWCETDQTVLANEQVEAGMCWRCGNPVVQKDLEQWYFKISEYADELIDCLDELDWPEKTKTMQKNWIGRSVGASVTFKLSNIDDAIQVFTTRPDTLFGVTYIALTPSHPLVAKLVTAEYKRDVEKYQELAIKKTEREIQEKNEKTGVFTGSYAQHPLSGEQIPIWIADYVLAGYGTGAVMGVPAHDQRDWDFATAFNLPIVEVIKGGDIRKSAFDQPGELINSEQFNGLNSSEAKKAIIESLEQMQLGQRQTTYRLRDWLVSRQRYWGPPIPLIECPNCGMVPVPEDQLPVVLPREVDFKPTGVPPLATNQEFMHVECPTCHKPATRASETMDTFVDSSWYFLRYTDPNNPKQIYDRQKAEYWMPVDMYVGGAEHTVLHLLYSRFFVKALRDMGHISNDEPFQALRHQGMILGPDHQKMSKSKGNVVNPDELVEDFGVDSVRLQLLFMGPFDQGGPWQLTGIHGVHRFLQKIWTFHHQQLKNWTDKSSSEAEDSLNKLIIKVTDDIANFKFNTAIAAMMGSLNEFVKSGEVSQKDWELFLLMVAPFAPHIAEELWHSLGNEESIHTQQWPQAKPETSLKSLNSIAVQVNGKVRGTIESNAGMSQEEAVALAESQEAVSRQIEGKKIIKVIYIPGKILNLVVN